MKIIKIENNNDNEFVFFIKDVSFILTNYITNHCSVKYNKPLINSFYIPNFHDKDDNIHPFNNELKGIYKKHTDILYHKYLNLLEEGITKEEARYILPITYLNDLIISFNRNELLNFITTIYNNNETNREELSILATELEKIIKTNDPYIYSILQNKKKNIKDFPYKEKSLKDIILYKEEKRDILDREYGNDLLLSDYRTCINLIMKRYNVTYEEALSITEGLMHNDSKFKRKIINYLIRNNDLDILSQVNYHFVYDISLNALDYMNKKNIIIPNITPIKISNYYIPQEIEKDIFISIIENNKNMLEYFIKEGVRDEDLTCFYLLANKFTIANNLSAKDLYEQSKIYCCNKSLKEIRDITNNMIKKAKQATGVLGDFYGPTCAIEGYCIEKNPCNMFDLHLEEYKKLIDKYDKLDEEDTIILKKSR